MRRLAVVALVFAGVLALPAWAAGGALTLHPAGFGVKSYASWKGQEGEPDPQGNASQALYFQKNVPTSTFAAGVAVIKGLAGMSPFVLNGLSWEHKVGDHCGAGAPRWNIGVRDGMGHQTTVFLGCAAAVKSPGHEPGWIMDSFSAPVIEEAIVAKLGDTTGATLTGLSILFDEGNETPMCTTDASNSCVHLDYISIGLANEDGPQGHCWTDASSNSNRDTGPCPPGVPPDGGVFGVFGVLQPSPAEMALLFPTVDPLAWVFYPNAIP